MNNVIERQSNKKRISEKIGHLANVLLAVTKYRKILIEYSLTS